MVFYFLCAAQYMFIQDQPQRHLLCLPSALLIPDLSICYGAGGTGGGVIQGTASEAVLVGLLAAREKWVTKLTSAGGVSQSEALSKLVVYTSDQAHSCVQKACMVRLGKEFRRSMIREPV
jgi:glutamate/tyrosine decarboxylase-like PLP-dependent enzyme